MPVQVQTLCQQQKKVSRALTPDIIDGLNEVFAPVSTAPANYVSASSHALLRMLPLRDNFQHYILYSTTQAALLAMAAHDEAVMKELLLQLTMRAWQGPPVALNGLRFFPFEGMKQPLTRSMLAHYDWRIASKGAESIGVGRKDKTDAAAKPGSKESS